MPFRMPSSPPVDRTELLSALANLALFGLLTAVGTWAAGRAGVPPGWRLASGAAAAAPVVGLVHLRRTARPVTWRRVAALLAVWAWIGLANWLADVRFW